MGDIHETPTFLTESKNVLPDVVHSQNTPAQGSAVADTDAQIDTGQIVTGISVIDEDDSQTESISEHIPSKIEYSVTESDNEIDAQPGLLTVEPHEDQCQSSLNIPLPLSHSDNPSIQDPSKSPSWPVDPKSTDINHISEESPVNLASTSISKETNETLQPEVELSHVENMIDSPRSDKYLDSLNEETYSKTNPSENEQDVVKSHSTDVSPPLSLSVGEESLKQESSESEEIIKLDIRGHGAPKFPITTGTIFFGPPPEGSVIDNIQPLPVLQNLLSPFLVGAGDVKVEEVFEEKLDSEIQKSADIEKDSLSSDNDKIEQSDLLVEEMTVDYDTKEKVEDESMPSIPQHKSLAPDDTMSFSTMTTDYKTICEEFRVKLVHLESAVAQRNELIEELTVNLQRAIRDQDELTHQNRHLTEQVLTLQHLVAHSEHDTIKGQLSDYAKYESMVKEDTKFYSALMSGGSSLKSSNGEKDNDREEITVNYSRSDLKSDSDDFQTGFELKLTEIISRFDESIEENLRNKLRESLIQVLCDEITRIRIEADTDIKELETQLQQDKHAFSVETRRLRELLATVKAGDADIDELRQELDLKHEREMENLRTYFEKKCSDMERSYSEEVYRGRACASPQSASSLEPHEAGDGGRRARGAGLPPAAQMSPLEAAVKQANRKTDTQSNDIKEMQEQHKKIVAALQEQISQLKARAQTDTTESNVSLYQQDIDLELEKDAEFERRLDEAKQELIRQLEEQIQVLLSDPDAELSSWPLELVALRDKIHDARPQDKEQSGLREEAGESDKWRQRRNLSFDQNRHLEEITKERDSFKLVATSLQRIVGQLVAYCAAAEDELNRTVLAELLARLLPDDSLIEEPRPSTPALDASPRKRVHFAPELTLLAELDGSGAAGFLQGSRDLSVDIKRELELSLKRLRLEAHELLEAARSRKVPPESKDTSQVQIAELVEQLEKRHKGCDDCELYRKSMEEAMTEGVQREGLLRAELEAALLQVARLAQPERSELVVEGYGTGQQLTPARARRACAGAVSLDAAADDALARERDELQQQLEAANRQLRATRAFVEEQAAEREAERDEFARRLAEMRDESARLAARLHTNATILNEVEQLEAQTREMNTIISELETRKAATDEELAASNEKVSLLREIIATLEGQLEQKATHEATILEQLEEMRRTIDERDSKMRALLGELESLRSERVEASEVASVGDEGRADELLEIIKEQCGWLEQKLHRRTRRLERAHDTCSAPCSEPSEDVSLRDRRADQAPSPGAPSPRWAGRPELLGVWEAAEALARAEDAALKRIADLDMQRAQLKDVAQEVRAERDVLQARMSEQALKISSLSARLDTQRNNAAALAHQAAAQLTVSLHDALAEVQRLKEEIESKDKQLLRAKQSLEEKEKLAEQHKSLYGNSCNPKDKVVILERELSSAQTRVAQLEALVSSLERDKEDLQAALRDQQRALAEREEQLQEIMALKLDDDQKEDKSEPDGKASARTLSDIVSISDFDEQDLQMRRAELKGQNLSLSGVPYAEGRDKTLNRTLPPDLTKLNMSSLNIDFIDHFDLPSHTPRADSLPVHLTSTQNKDVHTLFKRNVNETTIFGTADKFAESAKQSTQIIPDNCSLYPNRDVDASKDVSVAPKKINFSIEASNDNKTQDEEFMSLRELGITIDIKQENFPDILTQLKHEIKKSRTELNTCKSELKNAEEQLCEFPALKEEVEELKSLLENTISTMENDKKFYENQLEHFSSNKALLEKRVNELTQDVNDKAKDLHLLKEDILRRENMILELAKEKRNLTNKITELECKIDELQSRNMALEKCETENRIFKEKMSELQKLEQLVSEKNQQIDSLNQHLDRLDDMQRCLNDKTEELDTLKEALEEKSNELFRLQDTVDAQSRDIDKINEDNTNLNINNKELKLKLTKLEKEHENASLKLQNSQSELERVNSLNNELTSKIDELKDLTDKLKDKETEIEILNEDIQSYHEEIASLKEEMKMESRSPSPKSRERGEARRQASGDKKQLARIRKQISLLQHELDFNKKELNDKAFELARAKLDATELRNSASQAGKAAADRAAEAGELRAQRDSLAARLRAVEDRLREESDASELRAKLRAEAERCRRLEAELQDLRELVDRMRSPERRALVAGGARSPTAELERALRDQLDYSHRLDQDIIEQVGCSMRSPQRRALVAGGARSPTAELERALRDQLDYSHRLDQDIIEQVGCSMRSPQRRALVAGGARSPTAELERALRDQLDYSHRLDQDIIEQVGCSMRSPERRALVAGGARSPTAELERALRDQLDYSHRLDQDIIEQVGCSMRSPQRRALVAGGARSPTAELERALRDQLDYSHRLDQDIIEQVGCSMRSPERRALVAGGARSPTAELERALRDQLDYSHRLDQDIIEQVGCSMRSPQRRALVAGGARSPTAELERALRDQLDYSHRLDQDIIEQILSGSSDEQEEIPRLALNSSKSSSSIQSSASERALRLRAENDRLLLQVNNLEARLKDKDALITELNRVRDKLVQDWQAAKLRLQAEKDNSGRLQLQLLTHKESAETLQNQDSNMIEILKKRLESAMKSELELQQKESQLKARVSQLERAAGAGDGSAAQLLLLEETSERLRGEVSVLKSRLEAERARAADAHAQAERARAHAHRELAARADQCAELRAQLADLKRQKHEASAELARARELAGEQRAALAELQRRLPPAPTVTEPQQSPRAAPASPRDPHAEEKDQAIRYLHSRCLKLESCRKALVWQKRYLQRVLAGYAELEAELRLPSSRAEHSRGKKRFKCVATVVVVVVRMAFLVRRRHQLRALSAAALLRPRTPCAAPEESLARRALRRDRALPSPATPLGDFIRRTHTTESRHEDSFVLSTPRGEASAYLTKLGLVSRCLNHAMDAARDAP